MRKKLGMYKNKFLPQNHFLGAYLDSTCEINAKKYFYGGPGGIQG